MTSNHNVLDVLSYMFDYLFERNNEINGKELKAYLSEAGFDETGINNALSWLDNITISDKKDLQIIAAQPKSIRLYSSQEKNKIDLKGRNFLHFLECIGQLNTTQRELIISQAMTLKNQQLTLEDLKWVIIMVLSNDRKQPTNEAWLEAIIADEQDISQH